MGAPVVITNLSNCYKLTYHVVISRKKGVKMTTFLISLDEVERVKRLNRISSNVALAERTGLSRNTWNKALKDRRPTPQVLTALANLGADPARILVKITDLDLQAA